MLQDGEENFLGEIMINQRIKMALVKHHDSHNLSQLQNIHMWKQLFMYEIQHHWYIAFLWKYMKKLSKAWEKIKIKKSEETVIDVTPENHCYQLAFPIVKYLIIIYD